MNASFMSNTAVEKVVVVYYKCCSVNIYSSAMFVRVAERFDSA